MKKTFDLVAIDMDGTLLNDSNEISENNLRALVNLHESGTNVMLASGRHLSCMKPYFKKMIGKGVDPNTPIISCNGSLVTFGDKIAYSRPLSKKIVEVILNFTLTRGIQINWYTVDTIYAIKNSDPKADDYTLRYKNLTSCKVVELDNAESLFSDFDRNKPLKMLWFSEHNDVIIQLDELRKHFSNLGLSPHLILGDYFGEMYVVGLKCSIFLVQMKSRNTEQ